MPTAAKAEFRTGSGRERLRSRAFRERVGPGRRSHAVAQKAQAAGWSVAKSWLNNACHKGRRGAHKGPVLQTPRSGSKLLLCTLPRRDAPRHSCSYLTRFILAARLFLKPRDARRWLLRGVWIAKTTLRMAYPGLHEPAEYSGDSWTLASWRTFQALRSQLAKLRNYSRGHASPSI